MDIINPYIHGGEDVAFDGFGNRSRSFDGVDDTVNLGQTTDNAIFTASTWLKLKTHNSSTGEGVFGKWQTAAGGSWLIYVDAINIRFIVRNGANNAHVIVDSGISASSIIGDWTHIAGVADGTNLTLYVNGVIAASIAYDGTINNPTSDTNIGAYNNTINNLHLTDGNIADCRLYDTDLTASQISDLYNGTNITTNLVGHWLKDADNVLDAAGTNHGTNYGSKYSYDNPSPPVEFGSASRLFDGVDDHVNLGNSTEFSFSDGNNDEPFSLSTWVKMDDNSTFRILSKDNGVGSNREWLLATDAGGNLNIYLIDGGQFRGREYTTPLPENEWLHISATYDGSGGENFRLGLKLYVNGVQVDNVDFGSGGYVAMDVSTANNFYIGRYATTYADGKLADVRIYDDELTASEVLDLYNGNNHTDNLMGHWLTDNDDVEDKAGTNDGTNFGSVYSDDNPPMDLIPFGQKSRLFSGGYINTNTGFQSVFQSSFSISTWVRFNNGIPTNSNVVFGNQSAAPISRVLIFLDSSGALTFGYFSNGIQARAEIDQNFSNGDTGWFHYTAVVEPTGITIYKDGLVQTLDSTDDGDMSAVTMGDYGTDIDCYIGARNLNGSPDLEIDGNIADFRIYDSALSASDVTKIYNRTDDKSNIYAWYLTNSDDVLDHAGTNEGTNNGSTYSTDSPS